MQALLGPVDHRLVDELLDLLRRGPQDVEWLTSRARSRLRDATIDAEAVVTAVTGCTLMVGRPDGSVVRLLDLLDGQILTHRVVHPTSGRRDLWTGLALMPLLAWSSFEPLALATGGTVAPAEFGHSALVGPAGWLPPLPVGQLVGLRVAGGQLCVEEVDPDALGEEADRDVRLALTTHYREEEWWTDDELAVRPGLLNRAIGLSLLERPDLLAAPASPLNELLYDALHEADRLHQFRDQSAWEAGACVDLGIKGMPEYLLGELDRRAARYGMSLDQYLVLALGHLAWRTPFAEDLGPWESWDVEPAPAPAADEVPTLRCLPNPS